MKDFESVNPTAVIVDDKYWVRLTYEPRHEKKNNEMSVRPAKTQISMDGCPADLSLRWAHKLFCWFCHELWTQTFFMRTAKTLIRLGGFPADLSLRWAHMPFCWFCHEAAHLRLCSNCNRQYVIGHLSSSEPKAHDVSL